MANRDEFWLPEGVPPAVYHLGKCIWPKRMALLDILIARDEEWKAAYLAMEALAVKVESAALAAVVAAEPENLTTPDAGWDESAVSWERGWRDGYGQALIALRNYFERVNKDAKRQG